jgi:hypothetical protein
MSVVAFVSSQSNLPEVIDALRATCRFPSTLNRWKQQSKQNANDCNDYEQFD